VVFFALCLVTLAGACKAPEKPSSLPPPTTQKTRVLAQSISLPPGVPAPTRIALAAKAKADAVSVYPAPGAPAPSLTLTNPTIEGMPLAFLAVDQQAEWLQVRYPERPNGVLGWVRQHDVELTPVDNRIVISVGQKTLRVLDREQRVLYETNVAVGKPRTPTPLGRYYVDIWLPNPGRPYGSYLLSISGFSEVLRSFMGGRGQIAMHGWSDTSVMGREVSNGCIRMRNEDIAHVASLAPLGTPVEIVG
jgi:lipoprotein-anchoring transpeptidase ErfK/SrfK